MRLFVFFFCLMTAHTAKAQFVPMQQKINTPYGPAKITTYSSHPNMYRSYGNTSSQLAFKTDMTIIAKNGTVSDVRVVYDASSRVHVLEVKGSRKEKPMVYKPTDTKQISRYYNGKLQVGIPADSCWLFKYYTGKVVAYSYLPVEQSETLLAIQSGKGGPILPLTLENFLAMAPDASERVVKLMKDQKFWKAIELYNKAEEENDR